MGMTPEQFAEAFFVVRGRSMGKNGREWSCVCPWHNDSAPSLRVNVDIAKFYCHGCHRKGSLMTLARGHNVEVEINLLQRIKDKLTLEEAATARPSEGMVRLYSHSYDYWERRGLSLDTIKLFQLGEDHGERKAATVPMRDPADGSLIGFIRRSLSSSGKGPKYLYPSGFQKTKYLWGLWAVTEPTVVITEGSVDALAMWDAGYQSVAILGSLMDPHQARLLDRHGVRHAIIFTDNDLAGGDALESCVDELDKVKITWSVCRYKKNWGKDPAALTVAQRKYAVDHAISGFSIRLRVMT